VKGGTGISKAEKWTQASQKVDEGQECLRMAKVKKVSGLSRSIQAHKDGR
jgi:hypothetical protein